MRYLQSSHRTLHRSLRIMIEYKTINTKLKHLLREDSLAKSNSNSNINKNDLKAAGSRLILIQIQSCSMGQTRNKKTNNSNNHHKCCTKPAHTQSLQSEVLFISKHSVITTSFRRSLQLASCNHQTDKTLPQLKTILSK